MYNLKDDQTMQHLLNKLFRDVKELPDDVNIITMSQNKKKEWLLSMLAICDDETIKPFREYEDIEMSLSIRYEPDVESKGLDLIIRVDAFVPTDHLIFETLVPYTKSVEQKALANALIDNSKLTLFVVNKDRILEYAVRVDYNPEPYKTMLESITGKEYYPTKCSRCGEVYNLETQTDNFICKRCQTKEIYREYEL